MQSLCRSSTRLNFIALRASAAVPCFDKMKKSEITNQRSPGADATAGAGHAPGHGCRSAGTCPGSQPPTLQTKTKTTTSQVNVPFNAITVVLLGEPARGQGGAAGSGAGIAAPPGSVLTLPTRAAAAGRAIGAVCLGYVWFAVGVVVVVSE